MLNPGQPHDKVGQQLKLFVAKSVAYETFPVNRQKLWAQERKRLFYRNSQFGAILEYRSIVVITPNNINIFKFLVQLW